MRWSPAPVAYGVAAVVVVIGLWFLLAHRSGPAREGMDDLRNGIKDLPQEVIDGTRKAGHDIKDAAHDVVQ